jgi:hypothetical protein
MGDNPRDCFAQAFVLAKALTEPAPERNQRAENAAAVFVAFGFKHAQHVITTEQATEWQPLVTGESVPNAANAAKIFARHGDRFP